MWHFADLTDEQKHERLVLLDHYASLAQLSAILPLLVAAGLHLSRRLRLPATTPPGRGPSSPYLKSSVTSSAHNGITTYLRRWSFRLSTPTRVGGSLGLVLATSLWTVHLVLLCVLETRADYLHLTKRLGLVSASQLPLHYLLAWKSPASPVASLTGASWEDLNAVHRALGRVITGLFVAHAALYLNFFARVGVLGKRVRDWDVVWGLLAVALYLLSATVAWGEVRRRAYRAFVLVHVLVAVLVLGAMWAHVGHVRVYVYEAAVVYGLGAGLRAWSTRLVEVDVKARAGGLVEVEVALDARERATWSWRPGQHVYLAIDGKGDLPTSYARHPFSIASLTEDGRLRLLVKVLKGNTKDLYAQRGRSREWKLEGPYGHVDHVERLARHDRVLLIAGGVGATFIIPLLRALLKLDNVSIRKVQAIWSVKDVKETEWAFEGLAAQELASMKEVLSISVTDFPAATPADNSGTASAAAVRAKGIIPRSDHDSEDDGDAVEMRSLIPNGQATARDDDASPLSIDTKAGRPDLNRSVDATFDHSPLEKVAVYVCGPGGMGSTVRERVGRHVQAGRDVLFWNEEFGLS